MPGSAGEMRTRRVSARHLLPMTAAIVITILYDKWEAIRDRKLGTFASRESLPVKQDGGSLVSAAGF